MNTPIRVSRDFYLRDNVEKLLAIFKDANAEEKAKIVAAVNGQSALVEALEAAESELNLFVGGGNYNAVLGLVRDTLAEVRK